MDRFYPALIYERCGISVDATVSTRLGYIIGNTTSPTRPEGHNVSLSLPEKVQDTATGKMHREIGSGDRQTDTFVAILHLTYLNEVSLCSTMCMHSVGGSTRQVDFIDSLLPEPHRHLLAVTDSYDR